MKAKTNTFSSKVVFVSIIMILLIFQNNLVQISDYFSYIDEISTVLCIIYLLFYSIQNRLKKDEIAILIDIIILIFLGVMSNFIYGIQTHFFPIFIDAFCNFKLYIVFVVSLHLFKRKEIMSIFNFLYYIIAIIILLALVFYFFSWFYDLQMINEKRYGLISFKFIFENAGTFGYYLIGFLGIILMTKKKSKNILTIICLFLIMATTKGPQIIFTVVFLILLYIFKHRIQIKIIHVIFISLVIVALGYYQISTYLFNNSSPRYHLIKYCIVTANNYFPIGSGFATYGSSMSVIYYSPLYYLYGFDNIWGLNISYPYFLQDNYWPMVIAQFGWIGFLVFLNIFHHLFKILRKGFKDFLSRTYIITCFIAFLIGSLGSAYFTSGVGVFVFSIIGLIISFNQKPNIRQDFYHEN